MPPQDVDVLAALDFEIPYSRPDGVGNGDIALFLWFVKVQLTRHLRNFRIMSHHIGGTGAISSKILEISLDFAPVPPLK